MPYGTLLIAAIRRAVASTSVLSMPGLSPILPQPVSHDLSVGPQPEVLLTSLKPDRPTVPQDEPTFDSLATLHGQAWRAASYLATYHVPPVSPGFRGIVKFRHKRPTSAVLRGPVPARTLARPTCGNRAVRPARRPETAFRPERPNGRKRRVCGLDVAERGRTWQWPENRSGRYPARLFPPCTLHNGLGRSAQCKARRLAAPCLARKPYADCVNQPRSVSSACRDTGMARPKSTASALVYALETAPRRSLDTMT